MSIDDRARRAAAGVRRATEGVSADRRPLGADHADVTAAEVSLTRVVPERRAPVLVAAAVALAVALPIGAFALGRSTAPRGGEASSSVVAGDAADGGGGPVTTFASRTDAGGAWAEEQVGASASELVGLGRRVTDTGVTLRLYERHWQVEEYEARAKAQLPEDVWRAPRSCYEGIDLQVGASTDAAVGQLWFSTAGYDRSGSAVVLHSQLFGLEERAPVAVVAVAVAPEVVRVRARFADGTVDESEVARAADAATGWAVLAHVGDDPAPARPLALADGTIEALTDDGRVVAELDIARGPTPDPACQPPPPALPEPTGAPPADVEAADAAVRAALGAVFTTGVSDDDFVAAAEDGAQLLAARRAAGESSSVPESGTRVVIAEVGFVDETTAAARYSIETDTGPILRDQIATLVRQGDRWVVTTRSVCAVLGMVTACPPG